jgi:hypothetical protein
MNIRVDLIVDGAGTESGRRARGAAGGAGVGVPRTPGDLVVLSSETFEQDMWNDLREYRERGGHVIGLFDPRLHVARSHRSPVAAEPRPARRAGAARRAGSEPAIVSWDSLVGHPLVASVRVRDLAAAVPRVRRRPCGVPSHVGQSANAADLPHGCSLAGLLEFDGRARARDEDGGARGLPRTSDLMAGHRPTRARIVGSAPRISWS